MEQRIIAIVIVICGAFITLFLLHNRTSPRVWEAGLTILAATIAVVALRLQPETYEVKFPFVYFFDWKEGKHVDLSIPGHYFLEDRFLPFCNEILKEKLKHDSFTIARDLSEYIVFRWLSLTPFGALKYSPTTRLTHLGSISYGGGKQSDRAPKPKEITEKEITRMLSESSFAEIIENPPLKHLSWKDIKIPPKATFDIKRHRDHGFTLTIKQHIWFDLMIKVDLGSGGILANKQWAMKFLDLKENEISKLDEHEIYQDAGQIEIKWQIKRWSIGNPKIGYYRNWLTAISERLQDYFDWNRKCQSLHIEQSTF